MAGALLDPFVPDDIEPEVLLAAVQIDRSVVPAFYIVCMRVFGARLPVLKDYCGAGWCNTLCIVRKS